jgi:hypothetical protein
VLGATARAQIEDLKAGSFESQLDRAVADDVDIVPDDPDDQSHARHGARLRVQNGRDRRTVSIVFRMLATNLERQALAADVGLRPNPTTARPHLRRRGVPPRSRAAFVELANVLPWRSRGARKRAKKVSEREAKTRGAQG